MTRTFPFRKVDYTSKQDVFDYVCEHLREQSSRSMVPISIVGEACSYRSEAGACAIGAFLSDKEVAKIRQADISIPLSHLYARYDDIKSLDALITGVGFSFCVELQRLHDLKLNWTSNGFSETSLVTFAKRNELEYKAPIQLS